MAVKPEKIGHVSILKSRNGSKVFNTKNRTLYRTSSLGAEIIRLCHGKKSVNGIISEIKKKHQITNSKIKDFIMKLGECGLTENEKRHKQIL